MAVDFSRILVPVDFSDCSRRALTQALELAQRFEGEVTILHVYEPPYALGELLVQVPDKPVLSVHDYMRMSAQRLLDELVAQVLEGLPTGAGARLSIEMVPGQPAEAVIERAGHGEFSLVIMGTHGRRGLAHLMLGSVAERVIRAVACPVLVVR